jgi:hypothetical protein
MDNTATESKLTIILPEFRGTPINVKCEVEVLRDNGYGKLSSSKKEAEIPIVVVDSTNHQMSLKKGTWNNNNQAGQLNQYQVSLNQPLIVSCASLNVNPSPNLTLTLNGRPWEEISHSASVQDTSPNSYSSSSSSTKVVEGRVNTVIDSMFTSNQVLDIECKATYDDFLFEKKQLRLTKDGQDTSRYGGSNGYNSVYGDQNQNNYVQRPGGSGRRPVYQPGVQRPVGRNGRIIQHSDEGHDADIIHNRLLDLLDPAKHMHPGIPYDFYNGYILMVAKNVDVDDDDVNTGSSYSRGNQQVRTATTHLYGQLPQEVVTDLQRNYGRFQKISSEKYKIQMNPVDVLNLLGNHGFRVNGFTAEADQKMVWTLEQKDFENKINNSGSQQHRHN